MPQHGIRNRSALNLVSPADFLPHCVGIFLLCWPTKLYSDLWNLIPAFYALFILTDHKPPSLGEYNFICAVGFILSHPPPPPPPPVRPIPVVPSYLLLLRNSQLYGALSVAVIDSYCQCFRWPTLHAVAFNFLSTSSACLLCHMYIVWNRSSQQLCSQVRVWNCIAIFLERS